MTTKLVYTAIPKYLHFAHDYILRFVLSQQHAPLTPYSGTFWLLDTVDRQRIRDANHAYISVADEIWVFGINHETGFEGWKINDLHITDGVIDEIKHATENDIPVKLHSVNVDTQSIFTREYLDQDSTLKITNPSSHPDLY